jgi:parvulin-like peptidyl-prolyl isomerase
MLILTLLISSLLLSTQKEIVEKIYAVVNNEVITYSELKNTEIELTNVLRRKYSDEELLAQIDNMKKNLLNNLIDQKILLSMAKEKNYDVSNDVELLIQEVKKQNNLSTDEELQAAIRSQGLDYNKWKKQLEETRIQQRLIYEEIGSHISIGNAEIMEYYKNNQSKFTKPMEISLNCIYLDKANYFDTSILDKKRETISSQLTTTNFIEIATQYSELQSENKYFLGNFKQGEIDKNLEDAAIKMEKDSISDWIETENAWYILQLISRKNPEIIEYKQVRSEIEQTLRNIEQQAKLKVYLEKIKKDSYIKIYEEYK